jgi:hypothetical protein
MRRTALAMLLLTVTAGIGSLGYWLFSGAVGTLAPRALLIQNGDLNGRIASGMQLILVLVGAPVAVFVVAASVELARHLASLRRWRPGIGVRYWRQTLGVMTIRNINFSYVAYGMSVILAIMLLCTDSPFHFPRFREFELPDAGLHAQQFALAPDGNVWFESTGKTDANYNEYHIGYITPTGELHANYYSVPEPAACDNHVTAGLFTPWDCISGANFHSGPDGSVWFATSQGSFDKTAFIVRITPNGRTDRFRLPEYTDVPNLRFAFDAAGNLWYTRQTPLSLTLEKDAIGTIDTANRATEFPLPDNSSPVAIICGPDGAMWVSLQEEAAIGRLTSRGR